MGEWDFTDAVFAPHALQEMERRGLSVVDVRAVLAFPPRVHHVREGRVVIMALFDPTARSQFVMRVFVDIDRARPVVVTAYRSRKIKKYWGQG